MASVALDTESAAQNMGGVTSCTWTHVPSGSPNCIYVVVSYAAASPVTASATYGGVSMTEIANSPITLSFEGLTEKISVFRLLNPPSGNQTVVASFTASSYGQCGSSGWLNVNQSTPEGTVGNANGNNPSPTGAAITVPANGAGFAALTRSYHPGADLPVANKTSLFAAVGTGNWCGAAQYTLSAGSQTMLWTTGGTNCYWGIITFPINAVAAAASSATGTMMGV